MKDQVSQGEFFNPFFLVLCVLIIIPTLAYVLFTETLKWIGGWVGRNQAAATQQATQFVAAVPTVIGQLAAGSGTVASTRVVPQTAVPRPKQAVAWDIPEIDISEIGRVELEKGYVVFSFYKQKCVATGRFTATAKALQRTGVRKLAIDEVPCKTLQEAYSVMKQKAEEIVASAKSPSKKNRASVQSEPPATVDDSAGVSAVPAYLMAEDEAMFAGPPVDMAADRSWPPPECDSSEPYFGSEPKLQPQTVPRQYAVPDKAPELVYRGILKSFGKESRTLSDPKKGDRHVKHYCVRIHDENLGAEQPLWGNDLQRVIEESGAAVGDRVELGVIGETPVMVKGKATRKKVWSLSRLS